MNEIDTLTTQQSKELDEPELFEIRVKGHLDECRWADWFEDMTIALTDEGETLLTGFVADQAALYGLLRKVRDLGMPLRSVNHVEIEDTESQEKREEK